MTCRRCGDVLYWDEVDFGICDTCADILAIQYQERKDWEYWHEERASQSQIEERASATPSEQQNEGEE